VNNLHLVPINVIDIVEKLKNKNINVNEEMNYILRLEAIRDYCSTVITQYQCQKPAFKKNSRRAI
jgi:hypothetical protein